MAEQSNLGLVLALRSCIFNKDGAGINPSAFIVNHPPIFKNVGIEPVSYPYYDPQTVGLDFNGFISALHTAEVRSVFLLHGCAHNPTGVDPTTEQWKMIADAMVEKNHYAFFDCAYQGFASGDLDRDAWAVRYFVERGVPMFVCQVGRIFSSLLCCGDVSIAGRWYHPDRLW